MCRTPQRSLPQIIYIDDQICYLLIKGWIDDSKLIVHVFTISTYGYFPFLILIVYKSHFPVDPLLILEICIQPVGSVPTLYYLKQGIQCVSHPLMFESSI